MKYKVIQTSFPEVLILEPPELAQDEVGLSFNLSEFQKITNSDFRFVQDNHSRSVQGVLRGLHYQIQNAQGKLVQVIDGAVFDVTVDIRPSSPNFGKWFGVELSSENRRQLWIPPGFAHGFLVMSASADFLYKTTDYYSPEHERCIYWNDPTIGIKWPLQNEPLVSSKDAVGKLLSEAECY
ncbi:MULTISPECIES: dTDP-4-dehydrorhamnose 3,5-epimerase [Comamonadaceae]|uniref:dTDP-4-dehydrorhamnose 3,5-epimerase n=1 Tax=Comamonadaceae TaxID=80864 RepID=UPI002719A962|nr:MULTISPECIES: dTDP-4-dehydrorhamnose 3,5-epimerase [Comamonadaceae]MDO9145869.1 dTDP-4-dehydrorhamnose 3,5-epimerase [Rhodoferax sp.]MDP3887610.1 dTDP-4-dehydrorhamnose 3,5-epimerase [Hydrogenophaga sp.]